VLKFIRSDFLVRVINIQDGKRGIALQKNLHALDFQGTPRERLNSQLKERDITMYQNS
jgi:hypothetical protein